MTIGSIATCGSALFSTIPPAVVYDATITTHLWLDSNDLSTLFQADGTTNVAATGNVVRKWVSKSSSGAMTFTSTVNNFTWNGSAVIASGSQTNTTTLRNTAGGTTLPTNTQSSTAFIVYNTASTAGQLLFSYGGASTSSRWFFTNGGRMRIGPGGASLTDTTVQSTTSKILFCKRDLITLDGKTGHRSRRLPRT